MSKSILSIIILLVLFSCKEDKPKKSVKKTVKKVAKIIPQKPVYNLISDKNVVERLTAYGKKNPETIVDVYTSKGKIRVKLFKDTPLHRANFILLVKGGYFKDALFSRVAKKFMAQFGGSYEDLQRNIQDTIGSFTIPSEINHRHFHKKGALAAARSYNKNPNKRSSSDEFYFVEGQIFSDLTLDHYAYENKYKFTATQRKYYKNNVGAAHIDGEHTVFGQIIEGYNIVPKLTHVPTDSQDWPTTDIYVDSAIVIK